ALDPVGESPAPVPAVRDRARGPTPRAKSDAPGDRLPALRPGDRCGRGRASAELVAAHATGLPAPAHRARERGRGPAPARGLPRRAPRPRRAEAPRAARSRLARTPRGEGRRAAALARGLVPHRGSSSQRWHRRPHEVLVPRRGAVRSGERRARPVRHRGDSRDDESPGDHRREPFAAGTRRRARCLPRLVAAARPRARRSSARSARPRRRSAAITPGGRVASGRRVLPGCRAGAPRAVRGARTPPRLPSPSTEANTGQRACIAPVFARTASSSQGNIKHLSTGACQLPRHGQATGVLARRLAPRRLLGGRRPGDCCSGGCAVPRRTVDRGGPRRRRLPLARRRHRRSRRLRRRALGLRAHAQRGALEGKERNMTDAPGSTTGRVKKLILLVGVIAVGASVAVGVALATAPSGTRTVDYQANGTIPDAVHYNVDGVKLQVKGPTDAVTQTITYGPHSSSGWHSHIGIVLVTVKD